MTQVQNQQGEHNNQGDDQELAKAQYQTPLQIDMSMMRGEEAAEEGLQIVGRFPAEVPNTWSI